MKKIVFIVVAAVLFFCGSVFADDVSIDSNGNVKTGVSNTDGNLEVTAGSGEDAIVGSTSGTGAAGVYGINNTNGNYGILGYDSYGVYGNSSGWAGWFQGDVKVTGNLDVDGILTGFSESDPQVGTLTNGRWCTSDGSAVNCTTVAPVTSETDPVFGSSPASGITSVLIGNWNAAYSWGNHASAGYDTTNDSWTGTGNVYTTTGNVGIGTASPLANLHIIDSAGATGSYAGGSDLIIDSGGGQRYITMRGPNSGQTGILFSNSDSFIDGGLRYFPSSTTGDDRLELMSGGSGGIDIMGDGNVGIGTSAPSAKLDVAGNIDATESISGTNAIYGEHLAATNDTPAVYGEHAVTDYYGIGVKGVGGYIGVQGNVEGTGTSTYYGVYGHAYTSGGGGTTYGVYGYGSAGTNNYGGYFYGYGGSTARGVYGYGSGGTTNYGGYFYSSGSGSTAVGIYARGGTYAGDFSGNYIRVSGAGSEQAYIGGDGAGSDVQIGSTNASITNVALWNTASASRMDLYLGALHIMGGADLAEPFDVSDPKHIEPGMLVSIDTEHPGQLRISNTAYDKTVAGIISGANGIKTGLTMAQEGTKTHGTIPVALSGRVYALADASYGAIEPGDMLTTSDTPGHAMKVTDSGKSSGTIIGKAMTSLKEGRGHVLVLVTLQ